MPVADRGHRGSLSVKVRVSELPLFSRALPGWGPLPSIKLSMKLLNYGCM